MEQLDEESYDEFNLNFRIEDEVPLNERELELFNFEFVSNRATCEVTVAEGVRVLSYKIPATLPLSQFLRKQMYKAEFLAILSNILNQLLYFEENDMSLSKVMLNTKYMYIELSNMDVQLLYMPIDKRFVDCNVCEFIQKFIAKIRFADMQCVDCVEQILHYLDSRMMFSLRDFYNFILELEKDIIEKDVVNKDEDEINVLPNMQYKNIVPYLVRVRTNELIPIERKKFVIGKSADCDYQVTDNKKVSRIHCTFKLSNGECYIRDNNSTNHTYINGELIQSEFDIMLKNDDYIRMADEEFKFWVR